MFNQNVVLFCDFVNEEGEGDCYYVVVNKLDIKTPPDLNMMFNLLREDGDSGQLFTPDGPANDGPGDIICKEENTSLSYGIAFTLKDKASQETMQDMFSSFINVLEVLGTFEKGTKLNTKHKRLAFGGQ
jgi:hypothetical protein